MDLKRIYQMLREGDTEAVGASYLLNNYKRGRAGIMRPKGHEPADTAWRAGRDAAAAGEPNPFKRHTQL